MRNIWTIARREYKLYFANPVAYILAFVILAVLGVFFFLNLTYAEQSLGQVPPPGVDVVTNLVMFLLVFICPAVTMRSISEEQRLGTMELLLTAPVNDWELVVGKWLGAWLFVLTIVAVTWIYPILLNVLETPGIDQGPLITGYLGILLGTASFLALGIAMSSLFSNQVATFLTSFGILFIGWWLFRIAAQVASPSAAALLNYLDFSGHFYNTLINGVIQLNDVVYYLSVTALALFFGTMVIETRRWR
jgi:ABC-2 type transport system permease protein